MLRERAYEWWWFAMLPAAGLTLMGVASVAWLFIDGLDIWGIDWPVMWGFAITNHSG